MGKYMAIMAAALRKSGKVVINLDADLQNPLKKSISFWKKN